MPLMSSLHRAGVSCALLGALVGWGCTAEVQGAPPGSLGASASGGIPSTPGQGGAPGAAAGTTGAGAGTAGTAPIGGTAGTGVGGGAQGGATAAGGATGAGTAGAAVGGVSAACADTSVVSPGPAPLRRLTKFEYNNTVRTILADTTNPGQAFPSEVFGNGFSNDATQQPVSSLLASEYQKAAEGVAQRATATPQAMAGLAPCASTVTDDATADACARTIIESFVPRAYRRPLVAGEADELLTLYTTLKGTSDFTTAVAGVLEAVLAGPEFLYRVEFGTPDAVRPDLKRPTAYEMATRLSYLFWGEPPDAALTTAATNGELSTGAGVLAQGQRLLADPKSHSIVRFFFDNLLPISSITDVARDAAQYPTFSPTIGSLMQQETRAFLDYEVFQGGGSWPSILTAPYSFMNQQLAAYYGIQGVAGDAFQMVNLDPTQRLGLLTQGAMMVGTTPTNFTNPVLRGGFVVRELMCYDIQLPSDPAILAMVKPPDPYSGDTARERYTQHSANPVCAGCHSQMDPVGLSLENYDAVGLYRTTENNVIIDATGNIPGPYGVPVNNGIEMAQALAQNPEAMNCFASHWMDYAYGRTMGATDACTAERLEVAFQQAGFNVQQLMLALTQTDAFLYLGQE